MIATSRVRVRADGLEAPRDRIPVAVAIDGAAAAVAKLARSVRRLIFGMTEGNTDVEFLRPNLLRGAESSGGQRHRRPFLNRFSHSEGSLQDPLERSP